MKLSDRHLISIDDLSNEEILGIFRLARRIKNSPRHFSTAASGKILATLFYEPSTRTRLSFESAIQRLGGGYISASDMNVASSATKGESLSDTCRVVGAYSDAIVLRHPAEGASRLIAEKTGVPVINAGDGGHEHPTQTLCDLYTMWLRHGQLEGLSVALCGDLELGRTIHSLVYALARFKANVFLVPGHNRKLPEYVTRKLEQDYGAKVQPVREPGALLTLYPNGTPPDTVNGGVDVIYMTPTKPHQPALFTESGVSVNVDGVQLYITRAQNERTSKPDENGNSYPMVTRELLANPEFKDTSIMHPLPRLDEISKDVDDDERSLYFQQAANGIPVRMALLLAVWGLESISDPSDESFMHDSFVHTNEHGSRCEREQCVTNKEDAIVPKFQVIPSSRSYWLRCNYCGYDFHAPVYGNVHSKVYHPATELAREQPARSNVAFFSSEQAASDNGFRSVSPKTRRAPKPEQIWPPTTSSITHV